MSVCSMHFTTKYADLNVSYNKQILVKEEKAVGIPLKICSKLTSWGNDLASKQDKMDCLWSWFQTSILMSDNPNLHPVT